MVREVVMTGNGYVDSNSEPPLVKKECWKVICRALTATLAIFVTVLMVRFIVTLLPKLKSRHGNDKALLAMAVVFVAILVPFAVSLVWSVLVNCWEVFCGTREPPVMQEAPSTAKDSHNLGPDQV